MQSLTVLQAVGARLSARLLGGGRAACGVQILCNIKLKARVHNREFFRPPLNIY